MIPLKSKEDLEFLRRSGSILAGIMDKVKGIIRSGISTQEIDNFAEKLILEEKCRPAFKGYNGYPATACTSINEEIVHGIPGKRVLKDGDILSLDLGLSCEGYFSDAAFTVGIGNIDPKVRKLLDVAKKSLYAGIKETKIDNHLFDISYSIQNYVERSGFSVVRQFVGHGIGRALHEEPEIPNFGRQHQGPKLKNGMVFAIEPMVNMGTWESEILDNGWTAVTKDRMPSAHFEHTVAITEKGPEILTS